MQTGWIKLHRKIQDSPTWGALTGPGRMVMIVILTNCTYHETPVSIDGEPYTIMPGQWLTSIKRIRELAGKYVTTQNVRTALASMESTHFLTQQLTKGNHRIITVNNWVFYQSDSEVTKGPTDKSQRSNTILRKEEKRSKDISPDSDPKKTLQANAETVYAYYLEHVRSGDRKNSITHIKRLISKEAFTPDRLIEIVNAYKASPDFSDDKQFRIRPHNFFGTHRRFENYLEPAQAAPRGNSGSIFDQEL